MKIIVTKMVSGFRRESLEEAEWSLDRGARGHLSRDDEWDLEESHTPYPNRCPVAPLTKLTGAGT